MKCGTPPGIDGNVRISSQTSVPGDAETATLSLGLALKTTNVDFLSVAVRDSRGLTAAELFGSWTRWPRLPDVSLTQGQNPE